MLEIEPLVEASVGTDVKVDLGGKHGVQTLTITERIYQPPFPRGDAVDHIDEDPIPGEHKFAAEDENGCLWNLHVEDHPETGLGDEVGLTQRVITDIRMPIQSEWRDRGTADSVEVLDDGE